VLDHAHIHAKTTEAGERTSMVSGQWFEAGVDEIDCVCGAE
jgi:hypothetical protein